MTLSLYDLATSMQIIGGFIVVTGVFKMIYLFGKYKGVKEYEKFNQSKEDLK